MTRVGDETGDARAYEVRIRTVVHSLLRVPAVHECLRRRYVAREIFAHLVERFMYDPNMQERISVNGFIVTLASRL